MTLYEKICCCLIIGNACLISGNPILSINDYICQNDKCTLDISIQG